jgi:two-component system chemotaxis sensor kinase CheA
LRLPLTMAISDSMLLGVGAERFLLPIPFIAATFRPEPGCVSTISGRGEVVPFQEQFLPMFRLHNLFDIEDAQSDPCQGLIVVIEAEGGRCALFVDAILGQHQVVIKSLGPVFGQVSGVSGGAILGDGRIGLILDASGLLKLAKNAEEDYLPTQATSAEEATEQTCAV